MPSSHVSKLLLGALSILMAFTSTSTAAADIWAQLRQGGHVILLRHGEVDTDSQSSASDEASLGCAGQPNLNAKGVAQARQLGQVIRAQNIPIGGVLASPLCRTRDTARLTFGTFRVLPLLQEGGAISLPERVEGISRVIAAHQGPNNLVLVTHQPIIDGLTLELVGTATMVIVKPDGKGGFDVVDKLPPTVWQLAR